MGGAGCWGGASGCAGVNEVEGSSREEGPEEDGVSDMLANLDTSLYDSCRYCFQCTSEMSSCIVTSHRPHTARSLSFSIAWYCKKTQQECPWLHFVKGIKFQFTFFFNGII